MSQQRYGYRYFTIPFARVPEHPGYPVWFATWSETRSAYVWSKERPDATSGAMNTWTVGATDADELPSEADVVVASIDKCIDPPPLAVAFDTTTADFQAVLGEQLTQAVVGAKSL
jgi:hypothetical protein